MSGWGIAETAPVIEKIKVDSADYLRGLSSCGDITWSVYDKAFDFYMELISRAYEQGKKDAEPHWISCSEQLPEEGTEVFVYLFNNPKSPYIAWIEDSRWYTEEFEVDREHEPLAWMPLPEPWKEGDAEWPSIKM